MPAANLTAKGETPARRARVSREKHTPGEAFQRTRKQIVPPRADAREKHRECRGTWENQTNTRRPLLPERAETIVDAPPGALEQPGGGRENRSRRNAGGDSA